MQKYHSIAANYYKRTNPLCKYPRNEERFQFAHRYAKDHARATDAEANWSLEVARCTTGGHQQPCLQQNHNSSTDRTE